jgi:hypothetical protein
MPEYDAVNTSLRKFNEAHDEHGRFASGDQAPVELKEDRFGGVPQHLGPGDIWANQRYGVFVVDKMETAKWQGSDRDVYAHVEYWYTIRPANALETTKWDGAVAASKERDAQRAALTGDSKGYTYDAGAGRLVNGALKLDSYDDRYEVPKPIVLTPSQVAVEQKYLDAMAGLHSAGK